MRWQDRAGRAGVRESSRLARPHGESAVALGVVALVVVAAVVGRWLRACGVGIFLGWPPLLAQWLPHLGPGTPVAAVIALAGVMWGPRVAQQLRWGRLLAAAWALAFGWTAALALVDGWERGVVERLTSSQEYLHDVPLVSDVGSLLRTFADHILTTAVDPGQTWFWTTHVGAHPPGAFLLFVLLDRIGLGGGGAAGVLVMAVGSSACAAVAITLRAIGDEELARRALPFGVLFPGAVWVGVSADGLFAAWLAWGIALLALAASPRRPAVDGVSRGLPAAGSQFRGLPGDGALPRPASVDRAAGRGLPAALIALGAGLVLGYVPYLSYGLVLGALPALAVLLSIRRWRVGVIAGIGVLAVSVGFAAAGFWWPEGYADVRVIYAASIAASRPYWYFVWANLAALAFALGLAPVAALRRLSDLPREAFLLIVAALAAILLADLSGMSKAEVERIWLPFAVWLTVTSAALPHPRRWLALQAALALAVNHLLLTVW